MKIFKRIICLMIVVVLCFCSVFSVSAETIDYEYLVNNYEIDYDTEVEPHYIIYQYGYSSTYCLIPLASSGIIYFDNGKNLYAVNDAICFYTCNSDGSCFLACGSLDYTLPTNARILYSTYDIYNSFGEVEFYKNVDPFNSEQIETIPTETPTEPSQTDSSISTQNEIILQGFTVVVGMISILIGILTAKAFSFWKW